MIVRIYERVKKINIPEELKSKYKYEITDSLKDIDKWKAEIIEGNSLGRDKKIGDMDDVGYIAVGLESKSIIPISRGDEHHTGHDLLHKLKKDGLIPDDEYVTIFRGNNYIYYEREVKNYIKAIKVLLSLGFNPNFKIISYQSRKQSTLEDFVNDKGFKEYQSGEISNTGRKIINMLEDVSLAYSKYLNNQNSLIEQDLLEKSKTLINYFLDDHLQSIDLKAIEGDKNFEIADKIVNSEDVEEVVNFILSHNGIKNNIHNWMRKLKDDPKNWDYNKVKGIVGDINSFYEELNRISRI